MCNARLRATWPAVQVEHDRVIPISAANPDVLADAANFDELGDVDTVL